MAPKPFQEWFDLVRAERGWGTAPEVVKRVVRDSRDVGAGSSPGTALGPTPEPTHQTERAAPPLKPARVGRRRIRPLGLAFTMYRTDPIPLEHLDRLRLLAAARRSTPAEAPRDALRITLPLMEQKAGE